MELETLVRPVVEAAGLELVDVSFGREAGRKVLRVTVDRDGGVDLDAIADASERISRRLDLEDFESRPYTLEVSSPGVERPLRTPEEFAGHLGEKVKVRTRTPVEGSRNHVGMLRAADDDAVVVEVDGAERRIPVSDITSSRTVFEWGSR